jgi:hypothetical protein
MNEISSRPTRAHTFHVDLSDAVRGYDYILKAVGGKYPLTAHTAETRTAARRINPQLADIPDERLTHFTPNAVHMPTDRAFRIHVAAVADDKSQPSYVHAVHIYTPPRGNDAADTTEAVQQHIDYISTAQSLLFHHADLITPDPNVSAIVQEHMAPDTAPSTYQLISNLALAMREAGPPAAGSGWARLVAMNDDQGDLKGYLHQPTQDIMDQAGPSMTAVQISTKNDLRLQNKKWTQEEGVTVVSKAPPPTPTLAATVSSSLADTDNWSATLDVTNKVSGLLASVTVTNSATRQVKLHMENYYVRYLGAYIQFLDADGNIMSTPDWTPDAGGSFFTSELQYDNFRGLGSIAPILAIMAIPVNADPGTMDATITFPDGAVAAGIYGCGLGTGSLGYPKANVYGGVMTGLANLGVPAFLLAGGVAGQTYKPLYDILNDATVIKVAVALGVVYFGADFTYQGVVEKKMNWSALSSLSGILFQTGMTKALLWVETELAGGEIEDEIPFAGWVMLAINIATGIAQMAETIAEVATSAWEIPNRIATSITSTILVEPDPRHRIFPQPPAGAQASYTVKMIFKSNVPTVANTAKLPAGSTATTLRSTFDNTLGGGQVKFEVDFYIGTWRAASASTGWLENNEDNTANVTLMLFQSPVPITDQSIYLHTSILCYEDGAYFWAQSATAPTTTNQSLDTSQTGNGISELNGITLSQRHNQIGYAFKAAGTGINDCAGGTSGTQLHALQNIDIPGMPSLSNARFSGCGDTSQSNIVYDPYPAKFLMKDGRWEFAADCKSPVPDPSDVDLGAYYVDPSPSALAPENGGGYHLRSIDLSARTAPLNSNAPGLSHGRFPWAVDSLVIHPTGQVVAINRQNCKIMVTTIQNPGKPDNQVPMARAFAGQGINYQGSNGRAGLLVNPISVSCSYDGTVLILENLANETITVSRLQAFDTNGNPASVFKDGAGAPVPFFDLPSDVTYQDLAVAGNKDLTYIYVLYYSGMGASPSDYNVAIYQYGTVAGKRNPLVTTNKVSAARIATDMWHTLYTLNWGMTTDGQGNLAGPTNGSTGPAGRTVPSISAWIPPEPTS